jgi:eukaryotic-like serine/threonine-protein kinase
VTGGGPPWPDVAALLDFVLDMEPDERERYLAGSAAAADVIAAVRRLLDAEPHAATFLDQPAAEYAAPFVAHALSGRDTTASVPHRIGAWHIIREIGHGGMGAVYLAERADEQFQLRVAIKLVRDGAPDEELIRRFVEERQILASLDHPHIARLIDGGVTPEGVPWFAMEYVDGMPIDRYCDEHGLGIEDRIELCCAVCDAVDHAHRKLIVHRDLKPSNILIAADGTPRLLDFGIARLLRGDGATDTSLTVTNARLMTPQYASPEQVRGDRVTTATDIYSLGVLLYTVLTGRHPHGATVDTAPHELARAILEAEVVRPSLAGAQLRGLSESRLSRRLRGDIDTILLMALRREPERRYRSAAALATDLRRHLTGLPVEAQPDTLRYRAGKFVRRHRAAVLAAAVVLLSLSGGLAGTSWQAAVARREAQRAEQVRNFLVELFRATDPAVARGQDPPASELLARGVARVDTELAQNPPLQAELLAVLGTTMLELGQLEAAEPLLQRAHDLRLGLSGRSHAATLESRAVLGRLLKERGDYPAAEIMLRGVLEQRRRNARRDPAALAASLVSVGSLLDSQGEYAAARAYYEEALALERRVVGADAVQVAATLNNLGVVLERMGAYDEAEAAHREALRIRQARLAADHPDVLTSIFNLAGVRMTLGENAEAERMFRTVLDQRRRVYRGDHSIVATTISNLAIAVERQARLQEAEALDLEALEMRRRLLGGDHPDVATSANNLAVRAYRAGDLPTAEQWMAEALRIWRGTLSPGHPTLATAINNLGAVLSEQGRYAEAEPLLREALALRQAALDAQHADIGFSHRNLGILLHRTGRLDEAEHDLTEAVRIVAAALPPGHLRRAEADVAHGALLIDLRRAVDAESQLRDALAIRRQTLPAGDWRIGEAAAALGQALLALGRATEAESLLVEAVDALEAHAWPSAVRSREQAIALLTSLRSGRAAVRP